ncbi:MAG: tRNA (adenosine(37)-N6)-threonylcarbamoyltransferase complex dimerization subunit type 1 TsaB [Acutalibacteraceae bacterium]
MRILAVDTSAVCASVAVTDQGKILCESSVNCGLTHSRTVLPMVEGALKNADIALESIDAFACSAGPGSFTGIRIGVAMIKGLCDALDKPCVPVSTLEALAYNLLGRTCTAVSVMDARCQQVYSALFRVSGDRVERLTEDMALKIDELGKMLPNYDDVVFVGDGAKLCHENLGYALPGENSLYQRGSSVCFAAEKSYHEGKAVSAEELRPIYLRLPQAERELRAKQAQK